MMRSHVMNVLKIVLLSIMLATVFIVLVYAFIQEDIIAWQNEEHCINQKIQQGYKPKDIKRIYGGCETHVYLSPKQEEKK